ncbi:MAG: 2-hydroxyacyl-CoA dehydratase family protein [Thermoanaerobacterales bacterium]|nr:2-hydroxyacyl-CoA dehydratase family protein [Bacillota bacterium]MDI6905876.1 2-hydroxyacyl-CoA dehydratase family protein [Thermoanaerobacterales bacterium]
MVTKLRTLLGEDLRRHALASPVTYRLARELVVCRKTYTWKATRMAAAFGLDLTAAAYRRKNPVAWTSAFFPTELLYAMGIVPFAPETASAAAASLGVAEAALDLADRAGVARDTCSFHRVTAGCALGGYFPPPDFLLATTHLCDGAPQLFRYLADYYGRSFFVVDVPVSWTPATQTYVAAQLEELIRFLRKHTGKDLDPERLRKAFAASNRAREALRQVNAARQAAPAPLGTGPNLDFLYLLFVGFGHPQTATVFATLAGELRERRPSAADEHPERVRLLWLHLKPYFPNPLLERLAAFPGVAVAFEEMNHVYWPALDPARPFWSLAAKVLSHFGVGPVTRRVATLRYLAKTYRARGIVHFNHWGCRQGNGGALVMRDTLRDSGLPVLILEGDCVDRSNFAEGPACTRLEGFIEMFLANGMG